MFTQFPLKDHLQFLTVSGSKAYGTNIEGSDTDLRGVVTAPLKYYLGSKETFTGTTGLSPQDLMPSSALDAKDVEVLEIRKFVKLALDNNPNVLELLFIPQEHWLHHTELWTTLHFHRDLFLSKKCKHTFTGYAQSQLKRIVTHRNYLLHPPTHKPERKEFGLTDKPLLTKDELGAANALIEKELSGLEVHPDKELPPGILDSIRYAVGKIIKDLKADPDQVFVQAAKSIGFQDNLIEIIHKERAYKTALAQYNQWLSWDSNRNAKRKVLESRFGYDCKHAGHLVRLFRMGIEVLEGQTLNVDRRRIDAEELLEIRNGKWPFEKVLEFTEKSEAEANALYQTSTLRAKPEIDQIDSLLVDLLKERLYV